MPEKAKRIEWLKYLLGGLLTILALIVAFYQPILFGVAQVVAQQIAKSQEFSLRFKIHGSIFSNLYIEDLHLQPLPENTNLPLERVDAERVALRYDLLSLFKKDFLNLVELVELKDISIVIREVPSTQQQSPASLRMPAIIPKKVDIRDFNLIVRGENGDLEVRNSALAFQQGEEGYLACESLRIPAIGMWNQLRAGLRYNQGQLELTDFALEPIFAVNRLQVDLSGSEQGRFRLDLDGKALESSVAANVRYEQPADTPFVNASLELPVWSSARFRSCRLYQFPAPFQKSMSDWKVILIAQGASQAQLAWPRTVYGTKTTASILPASRYSSTKGREKFRNSPLTPVQTSFGLAVTLRSQRHRTSSLADRQRILALVPRFAAPSATFQILKRRPWLPEV